LDKKKEREEIKEETTTRVYKRRFSLPFKERINEKKMNQIEPHDAVEFFFN
jgi:hypothetical protein